MPHYLLLTVPIFLAALSGCQSLPDIAGNAQEKIPSLMVRHQEGVDAQFFSFSNDGSTYIAASKYSGVKLFKTDGDILLEYHYPEIAKDTKGTSPPTASDSTPSAYIFGAGFLDVNTWYMDVGAGNLEAGGARGGLFVRTINPSRQLAVLKPGRGVNVLANKDYVLSEKEWSNVLVNWRTGKSYPVKIYPDHQSVPNAIMTPNGIILSDQENTEGILINDPINNKTEIWKINRFWHHKMAVTADDKFLINVTGRRCTLWKWPERQKVGHCSPWLYGKSLESFDMALAPDGKMFAFAADNAVRVYRTEPFQLLFETAVPSGVGKVALSSDGYLAVAENGGTLAVWDIAGRKIAGRKRFVEEGKEKGFSPLLAFQPNGNRLAVGWGGLMFLEIPARPP